MFAVCLLSLGTRREGCLDRLDGAGPSPALELGGSEHAFLLFPWVQVRDLASKALSLAAQRIGEDWQQRYGYKPVLETFVEVGRYRSTCYQAAAVSELVIGDIPSHFHNFSHRIL